MNEHLIELLTRLENLIRLGTVAEVDLSVDPPLCRVQTGELLTDWRPWLAQRAGSARTSWPPSVGEQVVLFSPSGDLGNALVFQAIYSESHPAPDNHPTRHRTQYPDGAVIEYDPEAGALNAVGIKQATIRAAVKVQLTTPLTECSGDMVVGGALEVASTVTAGGEISAPSAVINGTNVETHHHKDSMGGNTGGPLS